MSLYGHPSEAGARGRLLDSIDALAQEHLARAGELGADRAEPPDRPYAPAAGDGGHLHRPPAPAAPAARGERHAREPHER